MTQLTKASASVASLSSVIACLASGPSLTLEDVDAVSDTYRIATNTTYRLGCDAVYASDHSWWQTHHDIVPADIDRYTRSHRAAVDFGVERFPGMEGARNSGTKAVELAVHLGARVVLLLGYDYSLRNGWHWHGLHVNRNPNHRSVEIWHAEMGKVARYMARYRPDVTIINCSRYTELTCFPRVSLDEGLEYAGQKMRDSGERAFGSGFRAA